MKILLNKKVHTLCLIPVDFNSKNVFIYYYMCTQCSQTLVRSLFLLPRMYNRTPCSRHKRVCLSLSVTQMLKEILECVRVRVVLQHRTHWHTGTGAMLERCSRNAHMKTCLFVPLYAVCHFWCTSYACRSYECMWKMCFFVFKSK